MFQGTIWTTLQGWFNPPLTVFLYCEKGVVSDFRAQTLKSGVLLTCRLPGKENANSHGARPVHLIITMIEWIWTSRLLIKNYLSLQAEA